MSRNIMRSVIIDSSSFILMYKSGVINPLLKFYSAVIPETVFHELTVPGYEGSELFRNLCSEGRIVVCKPDPAKNRVLSETLHPGERGVISLFYEGKGDYIIIDDRKGGAFCRDNNIPYINALLAVKILFLKQLVTEKEYVSAWAWLVNNGRYSGKIIKWAENADEVKLAWFI
jgi:predicted nucleic acid-binding protein